MDNFIHNQKKQNNNDVTEEYFTCSGYQDFYDKNGYPRLKKYDELKTYAIISIRSNNTLKFMIKVDKSNKLYNPFSVYDEINTSSVFLSTISRKSKLFKEVSKVVFDLYLKFLVSKNSGWLLNAERENE